MMTEAEEEEEIAQDIQILQKKLLKGLVKPCILGTLHFTLGLMALLFVSSCRAINSLPFWYVRMFGGSVRFIFILFGSIIDRR